MALPPNTPTEYRIAWNGEDYVATANNSPHIFMSRHPGSAFVALLTRLHADGVDVIAPSPPQTCNFGDCKEPVLEGEDFCERHI